MAKPRTNEDGYNAVMDALRRMGHKAPQTALAKMLGFAGRQAVNNWRVAKEVPESQALRVSILTGVPIEQIRPETVAEALQLRKSHEKAED